MHAIQTMRTKIKTRKNTAIKEYETSTGKAMLFRCEGEIDTVRMTELFRSYVRSCLKHMYTCKGLLCRNHV